MTNPNLMLYQFLSSLDHPQGPIYRLEAISNGHQLVVELPGTKKSDLEIHVKDGYLTIDRLGRSSGTYTVQLPTDVDEAAIEARLEDGLLTVTLPVAPPNKGRKLTIG